VRSTETTFYDEPYPNYNNYSAVPFPAWPTPAMYCLPRGLEIIQGEGANLQGEIPLPVTVYSDSAIRDVNTSQALLAGLGLDNVTINVDLNIFNPAGAICPAMTEEFQDAALEYRWNSWPIPSNLESIKASIQNHIGQGVAPSIQNIADSVWDASFNGGSDIAYNFAEFFEMQFGGGLPLDWANATEADMYSFLDAITYTRAIYARSYPIVQYSESNLLAHIIEALDSNTTETTFFVGHDTDLDAMATFFNIEWVIPPYATNHTVPGSMLRLDLWGGPDYTPTITASFIYTTFDTANGNLTTVNATFLDIDTNQMPYADFRELAVSQLYEPCVNLTAARREVFY